MSQRVGRTVNRHRRWIVATCVALVLAAIGDAGPEIIAAGSVVTGYDGPGPLISLAVAAVVATWRWRYAPLLAVVMSGLFLFGGLADTEFTSRLGAPAETVPFLAAWLQMLSFATSDRSLAALRGMLDTFHPREGRLGLADVEALVGEVRAGGLAVDLTVDELGLSEEVDGLVYRVVTCCCWMSGCPAWTA